MRENGYRYPLPIEQDVMKNFSRLAQRLALNKGKTSFGSVGPEIERAITKHMTLMENEITSNHHQKLNGGVQK